MTISRRTAVKALALAPIVPSILAAQHEAAPQPNRSWAAKSFSILSKPYGLTYKKEEPEEGWHKRVGNIMVARMSFPGTLTLKAKYFHWNPAYGNRDHYTEYEWQTFWNEEDRGTIDSWLTSMFTQWEKLASDLSMCCDAPWDCCGQQACDCKMLFIEKGSKHWQHRQDFSSGRVKIPELTIPGHQHKLKLASVTYGHSTRPEQEVCQKGYLDTAHVESS